MQNNSRRPSQERTSYSYMRHPLNPIVNNEYCSRQIENNCTIDNSKYLHTQLALFQEKIVSLEMQVQKYREQNEFQQREIENYQFELEQVYINTQEKLLQQEISQEDVLFKEETINQQKSQIDTLQDKIMEMQNSYQQERLQMKQLLLNKELDNKLLYSELSKLQISQNQKSVQEEKIQLKQLQIEFNEYKMQKIKEIEKLQEQINIYQTRLSQMDHIKTEDLQNQLTASLKELDQKRIQNQTMNQQILQLQSQNTSLNNQCNSLKEERAQLNKEKQAIETYYLDQLQKQDAQLGQMIKSSQQTVLKSQLEQKDKLIQELNIQKCNCQNTKQKMKELEQNNMTLILEVERLNNILKQKLLQLEDQDKSILQRMKQQYAEETETWKSRYQQLNKQNHTNQELIMVLQTELEHMKNKQLI